MREPYVPLFCSITESTLWSADGNTCKVWITLLAMADPEGFVAAAIDGIAARSRLPIETVRPILEYLQRPDPDSRSDAHGGRRLEKVSRGWRVLNMEDFRRLAQEESRKAAKRRWWNENRGGARQSLDSTRQNSNTETETETETETQTEKETEREPERETAPAAPPPAALAAPKPKRRPRTIKTLLPDDFAPNAEHATIARERGLNLGEVFAGFRDWCAENGAQKADWQATFRNWLRRERAPHGAARGPSGGRSRNSDALDYVFDVATGKA
jgi:hypothetical protein